MNHYNDVDCVNNRRRTKQDTRKNGGFRNQHCWQGVNDKRGCAQWKSKTQNQDEIVRDRNTNGTAIHLLWNDLST